MGPACDKDLWLNVLELERSFERACFCGNAKISRGSEQWECTEGVYRGSVQWECTAGEVQKAVVVVCFLSFVFVLNRLKR